MEYPFTINDYQRNRAILKDEDGNIVEWPQEKMPANTDIGDVVFFNISPQKSQVAKNILNEILNPETGQE